MNVLQRIGGPASAFDQARQQLDEWEKAHPDAALVVLILDTGDDIVLTVTGDGSRPTDIAGLCFGAAQMALHE